MTKISASTVRKHFSVTVDRVAFRGERLVVERNGKPLVALVSVEDLEALERLEDQADAKAYRRALRDAERRGEKPIPWEKAREELG